MVRSQRGPNQFNTVASVFDGTNDFIFDATVSGLSDSKVFLCSLYLLSNEIANTRSCIRV